MGLMQTPNRCSVDGCRELSVIRQPLNLVNSLNLLVPLCKRHNTTWETFAASYAVDKKHAQEGVRKVSDEVDAAMAWAITVHYE